MPLKVFKRSGIWYFRGSVNGRNLYRSCKTADKETAQRLAAEAEAKEWKRHLDGPASVLTFAQAAMLYRDAGKASRFLEPVEDHWKDTPVSQITEGAIKQSAITLYPMGKGATRNRQAIVPTQAIINHAAELGLCHKISVKRFKVEKSIREPVTREWVATFMEAANPRLAALCCFMFGTGARVGEAIELRWEDVDLTAARATIRQTKTGEERRPHLPGPVVAAMANLDTTDRVFGYRLNKTVWYAWQKVLKRTGLKRLTPHSCRHGFATTMLHEGIDPVTVAKLGGWKSVQHLFATYGHPMEDETITDRIFGASTEKTEERNSSHFASIHPRSSN